MRNPQRIHPIIEHLERLWMCYPDWRFWQLIMNMCEMFKDMAENEGKHIHDFWFVEDDETLEILQKLVEQNGTSKEVEHESNTNQ